MKAVCKVKIRKLKMKFPLILMYKILTGFWLPEKSTNIFPTYVKHYTIITIRTVLVSCDYYLFNPVKHYWSVRSNAYIVQQLL
jgi:hypothetical protein